MVTITIDGQTTSVEDGATILTAAEGLGIRIPTLCVLKDLNEIGACRVCVVRIEGEERLAAACNTPVTEGMVVHTNTPDVVKARRTNVEMILSEHRSECTSCERTGTCALQAISDDLAIERLPFEAQPPKNTWDGDFPLIRDASKCIKCMRCVAVCDKVQYCDVWDITGTGPHMRITVREGLDIQDAGCTLCGQCITHCPTGALTARRDIDKVMDALLDDDVITIAQVAPAVRAAWGEGIKLSREDATPGRMVAALRRLGFDHVYDTDFAADLTIMEEGSEFLEYLKSDRKRPMFTSCCPGWVRFVKLHYPQFASQLSSAKSPHQMMGALTKNMLAQEAADEGKRLFTMSVMPCVAKKYECDVPQLSTQGGPDVDAVITVREFDRMLRMFNIDANRLPVEEFDAPLGMSSGASTIFGRTGGVMEAALRTAAYLITGENPDFSTCDCSDATPERPWTSKELFIDGTRVSIAIASGLSNTAQLLDALEAGEVSYDFVEIMACPGGCVGGGGQPIVYNQELASQRAKVLNALDSSDKLRYSHENPQIKQLYDEYLGEPLSETSHALLHTEQVDWDI